MQRVRELFRADAKKSIAIILMLGILMMSIPVMAFPFVLADTAVSGSDAAVSEQVYESAEVPEITEITEVNESDEIIREPEAVSDSTYNSGNPVTESDVSVSTTDIVVEGTNAIVSFSDTANDEIRPEFSASKTVDGVRVTVSAPEGVFPAGSELSVVKVPATVQDKVDDMVGEAEESYAFDIKIFLSGEEIQPETFFGKAEINFELEVPADTEVEVYHIDDEITEAETLSAVVMDDSVTVTTDSFSVFVVKFTYKYSSWTTYEYSAKSNDTIMLSDFVVMLRTGSIYEENYINDEITLHFEFITDIVVSDPAKVSVTAVDGGADYEIKILDELTETVTLTINYVNDYNYSGNIVINLIPGSELPVSGTCGGANWEIDENGCLRIYKGDGDGVMDKAAFGWSDYRDIITSVVVEDGVSAGTDASGMFYGLKNCTTMDLRGLDVSEVTHMSTMFYGCESMEHYDITGWTTPALVEIDSMFSHAMYADFDLPSLDTSNVTDMYSLFYRGKDKSLDLSGLDTGKVVDMQCMFFEHQAEYINLDGWDTSNVVAFTQFLEGARIKTIDLSSFDLRSVEHMINFCKNCDNLVSFDTSTWSNFKPQKAGVRMGDLVSECDRLEYLNLTSFDGYKITTGSAPYIAGNCISLKKVNLNGAFDLTDCEGNNVNSWFYNCRSLEELDVSSLGTLSTDAMGSMLSNCESLKKLVITNAPVWKTYTGYNLISLDTVVIGGGMVFEDDVTLDNVRDECFNTYPTSVGGSDYITGTSVRVPVNENDEESNAFFTEVKDGDMYVYYLPKEGQETLSVTVEKDGVTTNVDLLANPDYYVIEDVTDDTVITIRFGLNATVTFMDSTDDSEIDKILVPKGDAATAPEAPTHEGFEFVRWATEKNGTTEADLSKVTDDMTVWAVYGVPFKPTVTVTSTGLGTAAPDGETVVEVGDDLDITITPDADRITYTVTVNGTEVDASELTSGVLALTDIQEDKDVVVTFTGEAYTGEPKVVFEKSSKKFDIDEEIKFEAVGFWADNETTDFISGDERYVPFRWHHADPSGDFGGKTAPTDEYTGSFTQSEAGKYILKVEFTKYVFNGTEWTEDGIVIVEAPYTVKGEVLGEIDTPKTGDSVFGTVLAVNVMLVTAVVLAVLIIKRKRSNSEDAE